MESITYNERTTKLRFSKRIKNRISLPIPTRWLVSSSRVWTQVDGFQWNICGPLPVRPSVTVGPSLSLESASTFYRSPSSPTSSDNAKGKQEKKTGKKRYNPRKRRYLGGGGRQNDEKGQKESNPVKVWFREEPSIATSEWAKTRTTCVMPVLTWGGGQRRKK